MFARCAESAAVIAALQLLLAPCVYSQDTSRKSRFAHLDHTGIHYTDYGTGDAALVFVHGWACDESVWRGQAAPLAQKIHVITIDLPGHGQSDKPDVSYTMDLYARSIDAVLNDAHVNSAIVVGHSNGTPPVREFYRKFPA